MPAIKSKADMFTDKINRGARAGSCGAGRTAVSAEGLSSATGGL